MLRIAVRALTFSLVLSSASFAVALPTASFRVGNSEAEVPLVFDGKVYFIGNLDQASGEHYFNYSDGELSARISGVIDPDPSVSYAIAVTDFGAPSAFSFTFSDPFTSSISGANVVNSSVSAALTDATGDGISLTPTAGFLQTSVLTAPSTSMGVDVGGAFSAPATTGPKTYTHGPFTAGPLPGPIGTWTGMSVTTAFTLSGGGDSAAITGFAQIVPEPTAFAFGAMATAACLLSLRRRS